MKNAIKTSLTEFVQLYYKEYEFNHEMYEMIINNICTEGNIKLLTELNVQEILTNILECYKNEDYFLVVENIKYELIPKL